MQISRLGKNDKTGIVVSNKQLKIYTGSKRRNNSIKW